MSYHLLILRDTFTENTSVGKIFLNGNFFAHTLEDACRGDHIKIPAKTCIPEGTYLVDITISHKFGREMPIIYNQENGYELINRGISFKGIRLHGGNDHTDSAGCPLVARKRVHEGLIYGSMEKELTAALIKLGRKGYITVVNKI